MIIKSEEKLPRMDTKDINGPAPGEQSGKRNTGTGNSRKPGDIRPRETGDANGNDADKNDAGTDNSIPVSDGSDNSENSRFEEPLKTGTRKPADTESANETSSGSEIHAGPDRDAGSGVSEGSGDSEEKGDAGSDNPDDNPATEPDPDKAGEPGPDKTSDAGYEDPDKEADPEPEKVSERKTSKDFQEYKDAVSDDNDAGNERQNDQGDEKQATDESAKTATPDEGTPGPEDVKPSDTRPADYQDMEKEELLKVLEELIDSRTVQNIRDDVEAIKVSFYKRHKAEIEQRRKKFMQEGGDAEAFEPGEDQGEIRFKELYRKYRHSKAVHNRSQEQNKQANLEEKLSVIEDLKELVNRNEDINQTFPEFRKLQKRWHHIGMVPQQNLKDLWDTYHHYVETFYDHIKINKELRDLDLRKNLETKIELCEKAEELLISPNIINAFRQLQKYHDQWRETGPVPRDQKDAIWERFREVTHQINKKHQEHFDNQKESQRKNLETKALLCEKAEAINEIPFENFQQAEKLTKDMIALQRTWKTIGFAPKKDNTKIYQRFRSACDRFFAKKREFNIQNKEQLTDNLQKKLDLCVQAEALRESTDWKRASDELIELQNRWKEIGPVPRKHYDPVWKRFRAACDQFFNRKSEFFSTIDSKYDENLKKKLAIIEKIENFTFGPDLEANLNTLKEYQRDWVSIGFVPIREKDNIQKRYRAALDKHFEGLKMDDQKKNLVKYRHKLEGVKEKPTAFNKLRFEREKFLNKFKQLESDITLWENNIGFFAKSKSAEATINEFREKIEQGKKQMQVLEEKIKMIDNLDNE
jgi:hypothetical protein